MINSEAQGYYQQANEAFVEENYQSAYSLYSQAIAIDSSRPDIYLKRAQAASKLAQHLNAVNDANRVLELISNSGANKNEKSGLIAKANMRLGLSLFELDRYEEAHGAFMAVLSITPDDATAKTWLRKAAAEIEASKSKIETQPIAIPPPSSTMNTPARVRHEWFQNENFVTITIFIKNVKADTVNIVFAERAISVTVKLPIGADYSLELDPLAHAIVPADSKYSVLSTKIEIKCKKEMMGLKWGTLEGEDEMVGAPQLMGSANVDASARPSYPTSSKKARDWDKLTKEVETEKPEGDAALNSLFQQIYKDADDDTRRAMIKSFTESNGTALSTNWTEVGKGRVETSPPDGMEARKYEM
ncbi:hypothetical protein SmJEL517_g05928 [Synchytrium microbalum]|uniref:SGS domain-containing protein n=1 Tax=Synchytrium microbalum TaxID=1806994 RepID=A0A507BU11_9FUNG|nr:uncharacterized protein SmJEL517_g05928 [Synchytrium microbalum]TPX30539.1 hypothetical protein SmJEL517_g05928 [Synchytrium microbalum]